MSPEENVPRPFEFDVYPESDAGGYSKVDCTVAFYTRISAIISPETVMLNLGAGRGANIVRDYSEFRRRIQYFRGRVRRVIGVDIDPAVSQNPDLDEYHVSPSEAGIPLDDQSVDIVISDHVLEHVEDPERFAMEVARVLKPGGWFCARTPAKWGYIGIGARVVPNSLHVTMLRKLQPNRLPEDVFPTAYRLNTFQALRRYFPTEHWKHCSYGFNGVPAYHGHKLFLFRLVEAWNWLMPGPFSAKYHIFLRKLQ